MSGAVHARLGRWAQVIAVKLIGLVGQEPPHEPDWYLVAALLAIGVIALLAQHRRNGRHLVLVVVEWCVVLALASVLSGGPGSQFLAPDASAKPAQRPPNP